MLAKTKVAACLLEQAARKTKSHYKAYRNGHVMSRENFKERIGLLLLYLQTELPQNQRQNYWRQFEAKLRKLYAVSL